VVTAGTTSGYQVLTKRGIALYKLRMQKFDSNDYRLMLRAQLETKAKKNPQFSLRAFSKKVGVSHPLLSQVLNRKKNISRETACRLIQHLEFTARESKIFLALVELATAKDDGYRETLLKRISKLSPENESLTLTLETFQLISNWYHAAILELTRVEPLTRVSSPRVAKSLGISEMEAGGAIERLLKLGLLIEGKKQLKKSTPIIQTVTDIPSKPLREHHRQMIAKAVDAIENQSVEERYITDMTVAIHSKDIPAAKKKIEQFKIELSELFARTDEKESVYQMNLQLFQLTEIKKNRKNGESK
jgi:uncharacterized protein (TIGR02147 family)